MGGIKTSPEEASSYLRKIRKPQVERRRRERMNQSIDQLKDLVADTIKHNVAPMTRVDKADILELTVTHLVQLQQQQQRGVATTAGTSGYCSGYKDCARAVDLVDFLVSNSLVNGTALTDLSGHLHNSYLQRSRHERVARRHQPMTYSTPMRPHHISESPTATPAQLYGYSPIPQSTPEFPATWGNSSTCYTGQTSSSVGSSVELTSVSSMEISTRSSNSSGQSNTTDGSNMASLATMNHGSNMASLAEQLSITGGSNVVGEDWNSMDNLNYKSGRSTDLVTIGDGSDNAIGHVIKDSMWRPW